MSKPSRHPAFLPATLDWIAEGKTRLSGREMEFDGKCRAFRARTELPSITGYGFGRSKRDLLEQSFRQKEKLLLCLNKNCKTFS
jgi:hypothetical protein